MSAFNVRVGESRWGCRTLAPTGPAAPAASNGFTYNTITGNYAYQWQTSSAMIGTC